jgi:hypothetical protein
MSQFLKAAVRGNLSTVTRLLAEDETLISKEDQFGGRTALLLAACAGKISTLQWLLLDGGASIRETDREGRNVLLSAALAGQHHVVRWLLTYAGASITQRSMMGEDLWMLLHVDNPAPLLADTAELRALLRIMPLLGDVPARFKAKLSSAHAKIVEDSQLFRGRIPAYFEQQRTSIVKHCPLPTVLQSIVADFAEPTREDTCERRLRCCSCDV